MVDREKRDFLIKKFRELLSGSITNIEYDDIPGLGSKYDPAPWVILLETLQVYDDDREHKVRLTKEGRRYFARCMLFLYSDFEYEWPYPMFKHIFRRIVTIVTLGMFPCFNELEYSKNGDFEVWPFFRKSDFEEAKSNNKFFWNDCNSEQ